MLRTVWLLSVASLILVSLGCRSKDFPVQLDVEIDQRELSNGLTVIMVEDRTVPVVSYQSWFKVGSVDEERGLTGLAHFFEHLMFKGTEKYGPRQFFHQLEARGAEVNAYTTRDYTVYYQTFVPTLLPQVIDMESDRLANLKIDQASLLLERQVIFEERRLRLENNPGGLIDEALWRLAYERHPYGNSIAGYVADLLKVKEKNLREFFKIFYRPSNLAIVIVGDFDPDQTFELIKKHYGKIPKKPRLRRKVAAEPRQKSERRYNLYFNVASQRFKQGYHITRAADSDTYPLDVLDKILFTGTNSRARKVLIEEKKVLAALSGLAFTPTFPGLFMISGVMRGDLDSKLAEDLLDEVIRDIQKNGVTKEEIKIAVRQLLVEIIDGVRTSHGLGQLLGTVHVILGDVERYKKDLQNYFEVTSEDIKRVAIKYLDPNNRSTIVMYPKHMQPKKDKKTKNKKTEKKK